MYCWSCWEKSCQFESYLLANNAGTVRSSTKAVQLMAGEGSLLLDHELVPHLVQVPGPAQEVDLDPVAALVVCVTDLAGTVCV